MPACRFLLLIFLLSFTGHAAAQTASVVVKDLDGDRVADTVFLNAGTGVIVCKLSTKKFAAIRSAPIEISNPVMGVQSCKGGFEFYNDFMRAGYRAQFRYEPKTKAITLIGMSRYEFGNAANDGSGKGSVNLITGDFIGEWHYYDQEKSKLIRLPAIKGKMRLPKVTLQEFSDEAYWRYAEEDAARYEKAKKQYQAAQ